MDDRTVRAGMRKLVALAYAQPAHRPWDRRRPHLPGAAHDATYLGLFLFLGLGLLVANLLPS